MNAVWIAFGIVLAAGAVVLLLRRSRPGEPACRWLAATAALWGVAFAAQGASAGSVMPTGIQLTPSDLVALIGLPVLVVGMVQLGRARAPVDPVPAGGMATRVADGVLFGLALLTVSWIGLLGPAYSAADVGPGSFTVDLIHPVADLAVLGGTLWLAVRAGRSGVAPFLALAAATLGDLLAVQARAEAVHAGTWAQLAWLVAICLLGASGGPAASEPAPVAAPASADPVEPPLSTVIATAVAAVAALVSFVFVLVDWGRTGPGPLLLGALLLLALVARVAVLLRSVALTSAAAIQSGSQFLQLAERTSDVVLLCDPAGVVRFASRAVTRYGYQPDEIIGRRLPDLVHPDDLPALLGAARVVVLGGPPPASSLACRVRSADGTWRYVEVAIARASTHGANILGGSVGIAVRANTQDLVLVTARDVSDQVALRRQVTHLTFHDGLTGLANRSYLEERAKDLLRREPARTGQRHTGAIFVDLDGFTAVNDSAGHGAGDVLLAEAGLRLRSVVPAHDTVARWGGDGFAVLVEGAASPQEVVDAAERIASAIAAEPFSVAGRDISVTASVGVAFTSAAGAGPDSAEPEHLLRNADLAMSRAKDSGGGRVEVFAAHMHADVTRRLELASDLRTAVADGGLRLEYQPVVELGSSRILAVEALVRWPRAGEQVSPAEFLGVAEDSGLIVRLGDWVLREACRQVVRWRESGWQVGLCVNLSRRQVSSADLAKSLLAALDETGLPAAALTLEVAERALIESGEPVIETLSRLRERGLRLAIDDFGTGYASLAYLRQLPVDIIKIDPSFVAGLGTDPILAMLTRTIVQVGRDLGIEVVAEGIERPEQLELLRAMGCRLGQGYLLARPMPAEAIEPPGSVTDPSGADVGVPGSNGTDSNGSDSNGTDSNGSASGCSTDKAAAAPAG